MRPVDHTLKGRFASWSQSVNGDRIGIVSSRAHDGQAVLKFVTASQNDSTGVSPYAGVQTTGHGRIEFLCCSRGLIPPETPWRS
jgi:hypothetical protein